MQCPCLQCAILRRTIDVAASVQQQARLWKGPIALAHKAVEDALSPGPAKPWRLQLERRTEVERTTKGGGAVECAGYVNHQCSSRTGPVTATAETVNHGEVGLGQRGR